MADKSEESLNKFRKASVSPKGPPGLKKSQHQKGTFGANAAAAIANTAANIPVVKFSNINVGGLIDGE